MVVMHASRREPREARTRRRGHPPGCGVPSLSRLLSVIALLFTGCSSYQALDLPDRAAHTLVNRQEKKRLMVASEAYLTSWDVERYFGPGLWSSGYFPVVIYLENRGSHTFEIHRNQLSLWQESSRRSETGAAETYYPRSPAAVLQDCRRSLVPAYLLTPLLIAPAVWAAREIEEYNFDLRRDIEAKAFPAYYRLEPGDPPLRGALFFQRPDGDGSLKELLESAEIRLEAKVEGSPVSAVPVAAPSESSEERQVGDSVTFVISLIGGEE
ncbi:MAG: hypothetical protein O7J95_11070 [Planctomycetota bacterium]|nr:hypothetical protein [Planctomycetota bacterium]